MATRTLAPVFPQSKSAVVSIPKASSVIPFRPVREISRNRWRQIGRMLAPLPATFDEALRKGWKVLLEETVLGADQRHRHGTLTLAKKGTTRCLAVTYTCSVKTGYQFGNPEAV